LTACRTSDRHRDGRRTLLEREADFGAAALLMPTWMIERHLPYQASRQYPDHVVKEMARMFLVSEAAMRIQLKSLLTSRATSA
jgi:Zn-dependent peptidase ImmA (M78 family)